MAISILEQSAARLRRVLDGHTIDVEDTSNVVRVDSTDILVLLNNMQLAENRKSVILDFIRERDEAQDALDACIEQDNAVLKSRDW